MKKYLILFFLIFLIIILFIGWMAWKGYQLQKGQKGNVLILTNKTEYEKAEYFKITIKNDFNQNICFSFCYPYLMERKNKEWENYLYQPCEKQDINKDCIDAGKTKYFESNYLPLMETGLHRIVVPVCVNCKEGENFRENKRFYSNEFTIK